jgi:hypothetical protein
VGERHRVIESEAARPRAVALSLPFAHEPRDRTK